MLLAALGLGEGVLFSFHIKQNLLMERSNRVIDFAVNEFKSDCALQFVCAVSREKAIFSFPAHCIFIK